jgi:hypothetical protein
MKKTRFFEMVSAIKITDYKRFGELVDSPYFNKNERVKRLWKWVMEKYMTSPPSPLLKGEGGNKQNSIFTKEVLEKAVRMDPSSAEAEPVLKPANFRMVLSDFVKLAEIFLLLEGKDITAEQNEKLMEIFKERGLIKSYNKQLRLLRVKTGKEDSKDVTYYNNLYLIECEELVPGKPKDRQKKLSNINGLTDLIWICMKLDGFIKSFALGAEIRSMTFYNEIMSMIENDKEGYKKNHSVIYSRYLILKMFEYKSFTDNPYFTELEKYTAKLKSHDLIKYNYDALLAYCRMNEEYERETVLMKKLEKKGLPFK